MTVENSKSAPPGTRVQQTAYQGPMVLSTMSVDPFDGEKYPARQLLHAGARFGVHSSEENFIIRRRQAEAIAYFTGGVRDLGHPRAASPGRSGVLRAVLQLQLPITDGYMTNNVEIDDRGSLSTWSTVMAPGLTSYS